MRIMHGLGLAACVAVMAVSGVRGESFPRDGWAEEANPFASPDAVAGGEFAVYAGPYPKSFNYYLDLNVFSSELFGALFENLLSLNALTMEFEPGLADRWEISDDKRTFTFHLNPKAQWSDGRPVTAADVVWTYEAIMKPENLTGPHKIDMERFGPPEALDERTVRFTAKETHWKNLLSLGFFRVLPKHAFEGLDFNKINFELPVVSGPYRLGEIKEGFSARLERRDDWWNKDAPSAQGVGNFQTLKFLFFMEDENAFEAFKKGSIDLFPVHRASMWVNQTAGERFDNNWIVKQKVQNYNAIGFQGFAMNLRRGIFSDVRVRQAMNHLLNREKMNATLMYSQYFLHRSYFEGLYDAAHPCPNELTAFDKERARALLKEAGWVANPDTRLLEKDGQVFRFKFLTRDASSDKFLVIYKEDLQDVGIEMSIEQKDWAAWAKDMDEFNYDMTWAAWAGTIWNDPESLWHSREADRPAGQNIAGLKSPEIDALIESQKDLFDLQARNEICRKIDALICKEYPYVLLWNLNYTRLLYWNKFGIPDTVLGKYGDDRASYWLWWHDEDSVAELDDAMKQGLPLPARPAAIEFDRVFPAVNME